MSYQDSAATYCVIGAGAAGLTAAKNLLERGIAVDVFEREDDVGGNWYYGKPYSSIYRSVHMISSKAFSQFPGFPMPKEWPTYLNGALAHEYLRSYAQAFGLYRHITFNTVVERIEPVLDGSAWDVRLQSGEHRRYRGVVIANGHLWAPRWPSYPGRFSGLMLHSSEYKTPEILRDKRVLVIGAGNSGCDIAVESSLHAARTLHSTRRGYTFWPKYMFRRPADEVYEIMLRLRLPLAIRRALAHLGQWIFSPVDPAKVGMKPVSHQMFAEHFLVNSTLLYHLSHGDISAKPDVRELRGDRVLFEDGSEEPVDVIVCASGFHLSVFPFLDQRLFTWKDGKPELCLNIFHPTYDNLFFVGWIQTSAGYWPLMHYQARLVARFVSLQEQHPERAAFFRRLKAGPSLELSGGIKYLESERYAIEVNHFPYRAKLKELIAKLERAEARPMVTPAVPTGELIRR